MVCHLFIKETNFHTHCSDRCGCHSENKPLDWNSYFYISIKQEVANNVRYSVSVSSLQSISHNGTDTGERLKVVMWGVRLSKREKPTRNIPSAH